MGVKGRLRGFRIGCLIRFSFVLQAPGSTEHVLKLIVTLYALKRLESDMGWLLTEGILSLQAGRQIPTDIRYPTFTEPRGPFLCCCTDVMPAFEACQGWLMACAAGKHQ